MALTGRASLTGLVKAESGRQFRRPGKCGATSNHQGEVEVADAIISNLARPVTGGVDTHKDTHVAAAVDHLGTEIATKAFPTTAHGYKQLTAWLCGQGDLQRVGVEGTGSWGAALTRHLHDCGITVMEVNRPNRQHRRRAGKSDPIDAIAAARAALGGLDSGIPKTGTGPVEAIRVLRIARRSAVTSRTKTINQIRAVLDTAPTDIREQHHNTSPTQLVERISRTRPDLTRTNEPATAATITLRTLGKRWQFLTHQIEELDELLDQLVAETAPNLVAVYGVGTDTAAALLIAAGDNPDRLSSEAAFAALCGVNPLPASSGRTTRHRLNRAGNRDANHALWRIVMARMAHHPETRTYVERRTTEGLSKREIMRCLKRYVARQLYPIIRNELDAT